jgi:hypothetical protein
MAMTRVGHREVGHSLHIYLHSMSDSRDVARKEQGPCDEVTYKNVGYITIWNMLYELNNATNVKYVPHLTYLFNIPRMS